MGKNQKYSEDQLLEAVIRFSEVEKKKIKATELAKWCRANIEGLEEVRDYHFTRPILIRDEKTGRMVKRAKLCTIKINEINKSRSLIVSINANMLLRSSNIDMFMEQPDSVKKKMIVETRETVDKLLRVNGSLTRENEALSAVNEDMKIKILSISERMRALQKAQNKLIKQVTYLMKTTDESSRREMLSKMGVTDDYVKLNVYNDSLQQGIAEAMDINKELERYISSIEDSGLERESANESKSKRTLFEEVMDGLEDK